MLDRLRRDLPRRGVPVTRAADFRVIESAPLRQCLAVFEDFRSAVAFAKARILRADTATVLHVDCKPWRRIYPTRLRTFRCGEYGEQPDMLAFAGGSRRASHHSGVLAIVAVSP